MKHGPFRSFYIFPYSTFLKSQWLLLKSIVLYSLSKTVRRIVLRFLFYIHRNIKDDKRYTVINDWMKTASSCKIRIIFIHTVTKRGNEKMRMEQ